MSKHPNSIFFSKNKNGTDKKFKRLNDPLSKSREKRIKEENKLKEEYFKQQSE